MVGPGRAGGALALAASRAGWEVAEPVRRGEDPTEAARGVALCVIATPDAAVAEVAGRIGPGDGVVAHLAGSLGLDVLGGAGRGESVAALHPLVSLPDAETGARRLASGVSFAVAGDAIVERLVTDLGGRPFRVADADRAVYHAAAAVAANHLVALLAQVERLAGEAGVPLDAYLPMVRGVVDDVAAGGPATALTGPVARGDAATVARHLAGLDDHDRAAYLAMADECARLAGRPTPVAAWTGAAP